MEIGSKHRYAIPLLPLEAHRVPLGERWAVVLAGGEGRRMRPAIHRWFGEARPKQFCAFIGKRTMLEHTWARARQIVKDRNVLTMAMAGHEHWLRECGTGEIPGEVVYQPCDRGTAATVFLGLAKILARG
ncbi:NTP transferase domain-containing protein, partial [Candidatus Sumerlaeota bacterium]|nr:NTP transferase domain-containing protein [Candidatus Sumerlaeota bacterium]